MAEYIKDILNIGPWHSGIYNMGAWQGLYEDALKIIDSGAVYAGFTNFSSMGTLLGATKGGNTFTIEEEVREVEIDGSHGFVKGSRRVSKVVAKLTCNFIEHTLDNFKRFITASTSTTFATSWDAITRSGKIQNTDYINNITLVGEVFGVASGSLGIKIDNAISDGNIELSFADKEEGVLPVTFTAHFDPSDIEAEPWTFFWPNFFT